jgi:hypothetical protein
MLKDFFTFKVDDFLYFCKKKNENKYTVSWKEQFGCKAGNLDYNKESVKEYVENGYWKIIEEGEKEIKYTPISGEEVFAQIQSVMAMIAELTDTVEDLSAKVDDIAENIDFIAENVVDNDDLDLDFNDDDDNERPFGCDCDFCMCESDESNEADSESEETKTTDEEYLAILKEASELIVKITDSPQLPLYVDGKLIGYNYIPSLYFENAEMILDEEKGTTVALLRDNNGKVIRRGIAKLSRRDSVYEPIIGTVIALHRLFELPVPEKFLTINR